MPAAKVNRTPRKAGERFLELVRECPLYPIRDEAELDRAIAMIDRLTDQRRRTAEEEDYRTVLSDLVHAYEEENEPMDELTPGQMLGFLVESKGVAQGELAKAVGVSAATISQVLADNRRPGRKLMTALGAYFSVDPSVFL
jgi:HTH-type transcriptional regulator/antitoxin HigA